MNVRVNARVCDRSGQLNAPCVLSLYLLLLLLLLPDAEVFRHHAIHDAAQPRRALADEDGGGGLCVCVCVYVCVFM